MVAARGALVRLGHIWVASFTTQLLSLNVIQSCIRSFSCVSQEYTLAYLEVVSIQKMYTISSWVDLTHLCCVMERSEWHGQMLAPTELVLSKNKVVNKIFRYMLWSYLFPEPAKYFVSLFSLKVLNIICYDVCDVTLSVHPHRASWNVCLTTVGIEPATFGINKHKKYHILEYIDIEGTGLSSEISPSRTDLTS